MKKLLGIEILTTICMLILYVMAKHNKYYTNTIQQSVYAAVFTTVVILGVFAISGFMVYGVKSHIGVMIGSINLANVCGCFSAALIVSGNTFFVIVGMGYAFVAAIAGARIFANKTGTKTLLVYLCLNIQILVIASAMRGSWMVTCIGGAILLVLFYLAWTTPQLFLRSKSTAQICV